MPFLLWSVILVLAVSCTERRLPGQLPPADGSASKKDGGKIQPDGRKIKPDGKCVRPPGGCFSANDCPAGYQCVGCGADPCCPMCGVCYGKCSPPPATTCSDIALGYINVIKAARLCTLADGPKGPQCTLKVDDKIACPCPTFINPANKASVTALASLKTAWKANKCDANRGACPPVTCNVPTGSACKGTSTGGNKKGTCQDSFK